MEEYTAKMSNLFADFGGFLEQNANADEFNKPREDYKRKYGAYPENDMVMKVGSSGEKR